MVKRYKPTIVFRELDIAENGAPRDLPRRLKQLQWNTADAFRQVRNGVQSTETRVETLERIVERERSQLIWKWNGYDLSQFASAGGSYGWDSTSISLVDDDDGFPSGKCIEMVAARNAFQVNQGFYALWGILTPMPSASYEIEFRVKSNLDSALGTGVGMFAGVTMMGCSAGLHMWGLEELGNAWDVRFQGGTWSAAYPTTTAGVPGTHGAVVRLRVRCRPRPANYPVYRVRYNVAPEATLVESVGLYPTEYDWESTSAHASTWDGQDPRNVGICIFTNNGALLGTAQTISARISDLAIYRLPHDATPVAS